MRKSFLKTTILREILRLLTYHSNYVQDFAKHDCFNVFEKAKKDLCSVGFHNLERKKVLDLGCGQRFPFALQCAAEGADVTALDVDYVKPDFLPLAFLRTYKHNGLKRACKSISRRLLFDSQYYDALSAAAGRHLEKYISHTNFVVSDPRIESYPLPSESFDLIASNAVLEHVTNVPLFATEIARLLRSGGYFYGLIHNFYSLSGGHNLDWAFPDNRPSQKVPPWDHLRDNRFPSWSPLNRLRPEGYQKAFGEILDILLFEGRDINHDSRRFEGERFLTLQLELELKSYPRQLLLTRSWLIICQKK